MPKLPTAGIRCAILLALLISRSLPAQSPETQIWSERETGIPIAGWVALELSDGRMAFGGHSLIIFDGDHWKSYPMGTAYAVRGLAAGKNNEIWAGATNELGYFRQNPNASFEFVSLKSKLPRDINDSFSVWHVFMVGEKVLFITNENILLWDGNEFTSWPLHSPVIVKAFELREGILIHDRRNGLVLFSEKGPRLIIAPEEYEKSTVFHAYNNGSELSLITNQLQINFAYSKDGTFTRRSAKTIPTLPRNTNHSITLSDGRIAHSSETNGISIYNPDHTSEYNIKQPSTASVNYLYESKDQSIWALSRDYIARLNTSAELFSIESGLTGGRTTAIGTIAKTPIATTNDGAFKYRNGKFTHVEELPKLRSWATRTVSPEMVAIATTNGIWIHTASSTYRIQGTYLAFSIEEEGRTPFLHSQERSISLTNPISRESRVIIEQLPDIATSIIRTSESEFWVGTPTKGVFRVRYDNKSSRFESAGAEVGLPIGDYSATVLRVGDSLVVACTEKLFSKAPRENKFTEIPNFRGTVAETSSPDSNGSIWLSLSSSPTDGLSNRVVRLSIKNGGVEWDPLKLEISSRAGAPYSLFADVNDIWIGTSDGLIRYSTNGRLTPHLAKSPLLFVDSAQRESDSTGPRRFAYKGHRIRLEFASLEYASREALRFQTKLVGIDSDWSAPTNEASMELAGLREGDYEFMVRSTIDGYPSEPASVRFTILPPWWRTRYAYLAYALGFAGAVAAGVRWRERSQRRHTLALEREVHERTEQLLRANEAKTDFITAMSHDVRTPMNGIIGSTVELTRSPLSEEQKELVRRIEACSSMLSTLVEDVLDFAAIESGQILIGHTPFSPRELLGSVSTVIEAEARGASMTIVTDIDSSVPPWLRGDAHRIRQILVNYGSNAVKYAGFGTITLRVMRDKGQFIFSVKDEGVGISGADQGKLFTRFARLNASPDKEGKGLGLAGCRAIAGLMNGSVGVRSQMGQGSEFWLRLPLEVADEPQEVSGSANATRYEQRALLVEDIDYSAEASKAVLAALGFDVTVVSSASQAIDQLRTERFDVLFLDINLPDLSGTEVAATVRSLPGDASRIRIIATTAHSTATHRAACIQAGMDAFLSKPLTPDKIHQALLRSSAVSEDELLPEIRISFAMLDFLSKGSPADLRRHAGLLLKGIDEELEALRAAIAARDREKLQRTAHRLITHARLAGDPTLIELAAALEDRARSDPFEALSTQAERIDLEVEVLREKLEAHLRRAESA